MHQQKSLKNPTNLLHHINKFSFQLYDHWWCHIQTTTKHQSETKKNNSSPRALPIVTPYFTEIWAAHYPLLTSPIPKSCSTMQTREIAYVWLPWLRIPMLLNPNAPHIYIVTSATSSKSQKARNLFHHKFDDIHFSYMTIDDAVSKQNSEYSKQKQVLTIYIPDRHTMLHRTKSCSSSFPPLFYLPHYSHSQLL